MRNRSGEWQRARSSLAMATVLVLALVLAAGNFVVVDLRLLVLSVQVRLAWVALVPALVAFAVGQWMGRAAGRRRSEQPAEVSTGSSVVDSDVQ